MSKPKQRIFLSPPHMSGRELTNVQAAFEQNWIAPAGPDIDAFEKEMCQYTGAAHAVALSSGTAAIHLALIVSGVGEGDEVLCSSLTFAGTVFPILYQKAIPVFVDSELSSWNMDPILLEKAIIGRIACGKKPKAVILVHIYGQPANVAAIATICFKYNVLLIEDAAESIGSFYTSGQHTGAVAPLGIYSFNGNKIITTSGGGMLVGADKEVIARAQYLSTQAKSSVPYYSHEAIGFNYRMSNICAAIGRGQLSVIADRVARRRTIFNYYHKLLHDFEEIAFMPSDAFGTANCWLTCITVNSKKTDIDQIRLALEAENIESRPLWKPMHLQPVFKQYPKYVHGISERLFSQGLCLPSGSSMTDDQLDCVVSCIKRCL